VHAKDMAADQSATFFPFERAAAALREREFARLADVVPPTLEALRSLTPGAFRTAVALMLERLGYAVITDPGASDLVITRDGRKYIVACAQPSDIGPTQTRGLARLHTAVINATADSGFYVTTRAFTPDAQEYAATAPIKLVDGKQLAASMKRSREDITLPETYQAMCRQCGDIIEHRLDRADVLQCANGHPIAATIALAALFHGQPSSVSAVKPEG
jgi:restriction endonuclease Mrr